MAKSPKRSGDVAKPDTPSAAEIEAIIHGSHGDPFAFLGVHEAGDGYLARCFIPGAETVTACNIAGEEIGTLVCHHDAGFFSGAVKLAGVLPVRYRATRGDAEWTVTDPYSFWPILGPMDDYFIKEGSHLRLFDKMGAHPMKHQGVDGFHFAVWAPNARRVSVVGDFNDWDGRKVRRSAF